jgi:hypothetical protein
MLDQDDKKNIGVENNDRENSELTLDEWNFLTWYRKLSDADRGYVRHVAKSLACAPVS